MVRNYILDVFKLLLIQYTPTSNYINKWNILYFVRRQFDFKPESKFHVPKYIPFVIIKQVVLLNILKIDK